MVAMSFWDKRPEFKYEGDGSYVSKYGTQYLLQMRQVGFHIECKELEFEGMLAGFECANLELRKV